MGEASSSFGKVCGWSKPAAALLCLVVLLAPPVWIDTALLLVLLLNAALLIGWSVLQLRWLCLRGRWSQPATMTLVEAAESDAAARPFFSVHVPAHDEPSAMLSQTLNALAAQRYDRYEVLVIDNNTCSEALWRPVQARCLALGRRFTFMHHMQVRGAKAGALNITRRTMDSRTTHVVIVDADYQVSRDFLAAAAAALHDSATGSTFDYVQFPQAYRVSPCTSSGLAVELTDYFDRHATFASDHSAMLLTGTLSVVSVHALDSVGGWPVSSVTEDAELGMQLQLAGFRGRFVNEVFGRGLLPPGVAELRGQRHRWIVGNLQTLIRSLGSLSSFPRNRRRATVAQLTAWCSFTFIPATVLCVLAVRGGLQGGFSDADRLGLYVAAATVCWQAMIHCIVLLRSGRHLTIAERMEAFLIRWSLSLSSGRSTLSAIAMVDIAFLKTSRSRQQDKSRYLLPIAVATLLMLAAYVYLALGFWFVSAAVMLIASVPVIELWIDNRLHPDLDIVTAPVSVP